MDAFHVSFLLIASLAASAASPRLLPSIHPGRISDECNALIQFKDELRVARGIVSRNLCKDSGFNFTSSPRTVSWKEGTDCCNWEGIICDNFTGYVIEVNLTCSYLQGNISPNSSLLSLHRLSVLGLGGNHLTGPIPNLICQISSLKKLDLQDNELNGTILPCLGNLSKLNSLDLSHNQLEGPLPRTLANCTSLGYLDVSENQLNDTFPFWLESVPVTTLKLVGNNFHGLIRSTVNTAFPFPHLETLIIGHNRFHGQLPPEYFQHSNLTTIGISGNMFYGSLPTPPVTSQVYAASGNKFTGDIPSSICNVSVLMYIDLSENSLSGDIPQCLFNSVTHLELLDLSLNEFGGSIPEILPSNNCSLKSVDLSHNHLGGKLPNSWGSCKRLEALDLSDNEVEDSFPSWLEDLPNLSVVVLRSNKFHGVVADPKTIHPFPTLHIFDISGNNFTGTFPVGYVTNFNNMMASGKGGGIIKYSVMGLFVFQSASVIYKGMQMELGQIQKALSIFDISRNHFEGEIPEVIGNLQSLTGLNLSHNNFHGEIPSSLGNLTNLEWLDLSSNNFTGEIPVALTDLTSLPIFNVSINRLSGQIPQGKQFSTFGIDSFSSVPDLCGRPLPKLCDEGHEQQQAPSTSPEKDDREFSINRTAVLVGYVFGTLVGLSVGYYFIQVRRAPSWLMKMVESKGAGTTDWPWKSLSRTH